MIALVAGAALLADLDQQHIRIAIDMDRFDNLNMSGRRSLVPQGPARPRVKMGLPDLERFPQGRLVHPRHHQHLAAFHLLHDGWNQSLRIPLQSGE